MSGADPVAMGKEYSESELAAKLCELPLAADVTKLAVILLLRNSAGVWGTCMAATRFGIAVIDLGSSMVAR